MKKGQNTTYVKRYFNDGIVTGGEAAAIEKARTMNGGGNKTLKSKNVARASKKKRK